MFLIRQLRSAQELITEMQEKNIKFNICNEKEAENFLKQNTYYKKIASYMNNFHTIKVEGKIKYTDLDFAYLVELSTLDMEFRFLVMQMCLNVEHAVKVSIINKCLEYHEDGYKVMEQYFQNNSQKEDKKREIVSKGSNSYCKDLILNNQGEMPIWVFMEIISFGELCHFYRFLCNKKGYITNSEVELLYAVRDFRNAAAHNHCLFSQLISSDARAITQITKYVSGIANTTKNERKNRLQSICICDFVTLLFAFEYYIKSEGIIKHTKNELRKLFYDRMRKNAYYFQNSLTIKNAYNFSIKVLDTWLSE